MFVDYRRICEQRYLRNAEDWRERDAKFDQNRARAFLRILKIAAVVLPLFLVPLIWVLRTMADAASKNAGEAVGRLLIGVLHYISHGK
jgi:hypothetical protein